MTCDPLSALSHTSLSEVRVDAEEIAGVKGIRINSEHPMNQQNLLKSPKDDLRLLHNMYQKSEDVN